MKELLNVFGEFFDRSPQPFGVAQVRLDDAGQPTDFLFSYMNPAMAAMNGAQPSEMIGRGAYEMWGGDYTWLNYFYRAAWQDTPGEFEALSDLIGQFLHVSVFPIDEGYCGFLIQDVTDWILPVHGSLEKVSASLFFFDRRTQSIMLTPAACEISGMASSYAGLMEFVEKAFGSESADQAREQVQAFLDGKSGVLLDGQLINGRWLRMSLELVDKSDRFAFGFLEDITQARLAEERSARRMEIIDSLSRENFALYLVDFDEDKVEPYRLRAEEGANSFGLDLTAATFTDAMSSYVNERVMPQDRQRVAEEASRESIIEHFREDDGEASITYRCLTDGEEQYVELRFIQLPGNFAKAVMAARNVSDEMREQMRQKAALQTALELAEHASSAKSTFLTNMSHDFRTPMNAISGFATIALDHMEDAGRVRDCLHKILLSSDHLLNLVNDILDVSRIESGKLSLSEDVVNLYELGDDLASMFGEKAREGGIDFTVDVAGLVHPLVVSDTMRLNQILVNTVGNALKFTNRGGMVAVTLREGSDAPRGFGSYVLTVRDTGCGMTPEFLDKLFDPFEREGVGYTNQTEGTGLGMTITKSLVDLLGGSIGVESAVGRGTTFTIRLPLRLADDHAAGEAEGDEGRNCPDTRDFSGYRVLVVDDDDLSREILVEILKDHGFVLEEARDGDAAVQKIASVEPFHFDAVLMDMRMPRMDGDEATRVIRDLDRPDAATLPIIAETADAFEEGLRRAKDAGMTDLTTKPLNMHELLGLLDKYLPPRS